MGWKIKVPKFNFPSVPDVIKVLTTAENIAAAGQVIVNVAGAVLDAGDAEDSQLQEPVLQLFNNYERASRLLEQRAEISEPVSDELSLPTGFVTRSKKMVGLWSNPTAVTGDSPENFDMYKDLSILTATAGIPSKIEVGPGLERDTTAQIAKAIFASGAVLEDQLDDKDPVKTIDFKITSHKKDCAIQVKHVFYNIPLVSRTQESCWHSAIHIKMAAAKALILTQDQNTTQFFTDASEGAQDTGPNWVSTVIIHWPRRPDAEAALQGFFNIFTQKFTDYKLELNTALGITQVLKIRTPEDTSPAILLAKVRSVVQEMLKSTQAGFIAMPDIDVSAVEMSI
ncbi:uncharacterized protein Aud_009489 [Aspergillus udagawae]|uniref:Uncharacterized protein n=1 Tax=Aspergillus udagawae TaxID=91492 RepID=A0A8E0V421_9EURO|nr:uncharacterized protein Aud_009489 [Aspergillus udagawae]GIC93010.1 hypothetical protein Aud_009489 [Aspergillus udagawae]